ncbi:uncharacterized protein [Patagioenas fasciata]|uniref:uncharacterized protein n=1 Tax=Patagioenas fasciata TaxID=372321 RepID=UPI003A99B80A
MQAGVCRWLWGQLGAAFAVRPWLLPGQGARGPQEVSQETGEQLQPRNPSPARWLPLRCGALAGDTTEPWHCNQELRHLKWRAGKIKVFALSSDAIAKSRKPASSCPLLRSCLVLCGQGTELPEEVVPRSPALEHRPHPFPSIVCVCMARGVCASGCSAAGAAVGLPPGPAKTERPSEPFPAAPRGASSAPPALRSPCKLIFVPLHKPILHETWRDGARVAQG